MIDGMAEARVSFHIGARDRARTRARDRARARAMAMARDRAMWRTKVCLMPSSPGRSFI